MTKEEKAEKLSNFKDWVLMIEERVLDLMMNLSKEDKVLFDYSVQSLDEVEKYLIRRFELADLKDQKNKFEIDACLSYVIEVFRRNWPESEFVIELEDERNILFNRPAIRLKPAIGMDFSPYQIVSSTLHLKRVGGFRKIFEAKLKRYNAALLLLRSKKL